MFSAHCPRHGADVLLSAHSIVSIDNREDGIVVHWRCPCGGRGNFRTGRPRQSPAA
jgi:hypothetical protein